MIFSAAIFAVFTYYLPWHVHQRAIDKVITVFGYYEPVHAVVIDAGSTGSRGAATIASLIEKAKDEIPEKYWSSTPLILKATAGLRLLPPEKAEALLAAVNDLFKRTPFLTGDESVAIMDGTDEGIFSWFTVNFLLELFNYNPIRTVAALDLGGGSTQVTFYSTTPTSLTEKQFIHDAVTPAGVIPVYTRSYLGLGLMAARKEIVTVNQTNKTEVISECVNTVVKNRKFHYSGVDYYVNGPSKYLTTIIGGDSLTTKQKVPIVDFSKCLEYIQNYVTSIAKPVIELPDKQIYAFSYYFERAVDIALIDEYKGGSVKVNDFKTAALKVCKEANPDQPFMCLDLTFIWVLLEKGFGLRPDTLVYLYTNILGHEINWALGSAYSLLEGLTTLDTTSFS